MTSDPQKWWQQTEVLSGLGSVVILLVLTFGLGMQGWTFLLALGLAALTYWGLSLALRRPQAAATILPSAGEMLSALKSESSQIPFPPVQQQVRKITARAHDILDYLHSHPDTTAQWQAYIRECLDSALAGTHQFIEICPHLTSGDDPSVQRYSEFLSTLAGTLDGVYKKLIGEDTASFESQIEGYKNTLQEINQVYLGGDNTP